MPQSNRFAARSAIAALAAIGLSLSAAPAFAEQMSVDYRDLDLSTAKGQRTLERRIDVAARKVCAYGTTVTGSRIPSTQQAECYNQAKAGARSAMAGLLEGKVGLGG